jgi:glycosyltransferase involved in cell wall biosynthesis
VVSREKPIGQDMNLPFIDIVVPTFNRVAMLDGVVSSLLHQTYPAERYLIIVVDDGSSDGTWTALKELAGRHVNVRALNIAHAGSYAARNRGWREGEGEIVAFTDDDCLADRDWLLSIARSLAAHPTALGVQGKTVTLPHLVTPLTHQVVVNGPNTIYHTCNVAYRRSALTAVGGFDEEVVHYSGDTELGVAVSARGPVIFCPEAIVVHPPRPRAFLNRKEWGDRLEEALRLYCRYPEFYRRNRGPHFLLVVVLRWVFGSTIKQTATHLRWLMRDPALYLKFLARLINERAVLLTMLPRFWREHRGWVKTLKSGRE